MNTTFKKSVLASLAGIVLLQGIAFLFRFSGFTQFLFSVIGSALVLFAADRFFGNTDKDAYSSARKQPWAGRLGGTAFSGRGSHGL